MVLPYNGCIVGYGVPVVDVAFGFILLVNDGLLSVALDLGGWVGVEASRLSSCLRGICFVNIGAG